MATPAELFFFDRAGYSYDPKTETATQGRWRGALALADAERRARENVWTAEWEPDVWPHGHAGCDCEHLEHMSCVLYDRRGVVLASLGSICGAGQNGYARVVEAELALEALAEIQSALEAAI